MVTIAIHGTGRMAAAISRVAEKTDDVRIAALIGPQSPDWNTDIPYFPGLGEWGGKPDFLIDFSMPVGTEAVSKWCMENGVPLVCGVTGLTESAMAALESAGAKVPVLWSPNLSLGVNLLAELAGRAGALLPDAVPVAIEDIHHQWKKDAPSGTALMLGERVAEGRQESDSAISYSSVREGEVIGDHTVRFSLGGEEFELVHRAHDRSIYASGAISAGSWLMKQQAGLYSARDWLSGS